LYDILEKLSFHIINLFNILLGYQDFLQYILNTCSIFIVLLILSVIKPLLIDKIKLLYSCNILRISNIFCLIYKIPVTNIKLYFCYIIFLFLFLFLFFWIGYIYVPIFRPFLWFILGITSIMFGGFTFIYAVLHYKHNKNNKLFILLLIISLIFILIGCILIIYFGKYTIFFNGSNNSNQGGGNSNNPNPGPNNSNPGPNNPY